VNGTDGEWNEPSTRLPASWLLFLSFRKTQECGKWILTVGERIQPGSQKINKRVSIFTPSLLSRKVRSAY
jgi:hypothetical protein